MPSPIPEFARSWPGMAQLEGLGERLGILPQHPDRVDSGVPAEPIRPLYSATRSGLHLFLRMAQDLEVEGLEVVPRRGPAILAPNHLNVHDSTVLMAVVPRVLRFVGKAEYMNDVSTRMFFMIFGSIPVNRADADSGRAALDAAAHVIRRGDLFGIFPEGTRSRDGLLHRGKTGAARLAIDTDTPIIPVGLVGTEHLQGHDDPVFSMRTGKSVTVRFGEPIRPERYRSRADQALAPRQMTDDLMFEIAQLTGQRYVDEYMKRPDET